MDTPVSLDINFVQTLNTIKRTYQSERRERESKESVLSVCLDDDDDINYLMMMIILSI